MATDAAGNIHISSRSVTLDCLQYTSNASGTWQSEIVNPAKGTGYYTSIAVDGGGHVHISYLDSARDLVGYATNASGSWQNTTVGTIDGYRDNTSLVLDSSGNVHILYARIVYTDLAPALYDAEIRHVTNASGAWATETLATTSDGYESRVYSCLGIDSQGSLHICFYQSSSTTYFLYYASEAGGWVPAAIDYGKPGGLRVDSSDAVYISYFEPYSEDLKLASNASGGWQTETVDAAGSVGSLNSLDLDDAGGVHISYLDSTNADLKYATWEGTGWVTAKVVDTLYRVATTAIAAVGGVPAICYAENALGGLVTFMFASEAAGVWSVAQLPSRGKVGEYCSLALDGEGFLRASYYDAGGKDLRCASNAAGSWTTALVDSQYDSGRYSSIDLDSAGAAHIAYHQFQPISTWNPSARTAIRYATDSSGSWARTTIESMETTTTLGVGRYASLGLDSGDHAHISYYKELQGMSAPVGYLWYATNRSGAWVRTQIEGGSYGVGKWTSLAVNLADFVHVSYQHGWNGDLKYGTDQWGGWALAYLDTTGSVGEHTSIALDAFAMNRAHVSYYDATNGDLKHCTSESGVWVAEAVDSSGDVGLYTSIAVDFLNRVHISYLERIADSDFFRLKYAVRDGGVWTSEVVESAGEVGPSTAIAVSADGEVVHIVHTALDGSFRYSSRACTDEDGDTYAVEGNECGAVDCDDDNPSVHPGATEACNGIDDNCDGVTDDVDADEDGYLAAACGGADCDDTSANVNPGMTEAPGNGIDDDCDGQIDEGCFIATAAFGSALHGKVEVLRVFRDRCLETVPAGQAVVRLYYRLSPPLAKWIGEREWLRSMVRTLLLPVIGVVWLLV